jgi:anti-sigma factor RsiW
MNQRRDDQAPKHKTGTPYVSQEELNAFMDGELDRRRADEIASQLEQDTDLQRRLAGLKQVNDQLKAYGREQETGALPARLRSMIDSWLKRN